MISLLIIAVAAFFLFRLLGGAPQLRVRRHAPAGEATAKIAELTDYARQLRANKNYRRAEKTYLQILKIDHRHAPTYSRLGTLYATMNNQNDAIECFQLAAQLDPSGATYYNLGVAYHENRNPAKSIAALEKSVMFEPSVPRHVALAKAYNKMGEGSKMITSLEQAANLDPTTKVLWLLADAYAAAGREEEQEATYVRIRTVDPKDPRIRAMDKVTAAANSTKQKLEKSKA